MTDDRPMLNRLCSCGVPLNQHNAFFVRCREYRVPHAIDWSGQNSDAIAGAKSAATKRARGQDLIPKLYLSGSQHKTTWRAHGSADEGPACQCSRKPCVAGCAGQSTAAVGSV